MTKFTDFKADVALSTYRHVLNDGVKPLIGYSKKLNKVETADKQLLLLGTVHRLALPYFEKGFFELEIFKRKFSGNGQYKEFKVLEMFPDGYQLFGAFKGHSELIRLIEALLTTRSQEATKHLVVGVGTQPVFKGSTHAELIQTCETLLESFERERVERLYRAICTKNGWGKYATTGEPAVRTEVRTASISTPAEFLENLMNKAG